MQDRPTAAELLDAVREFLADEIVPNLSDHRTRFRTLVAVNALTILQREAEEETQHIRDEASALRVLLNSDAPLPDDAGAQRQLVLDLNAELASRIRGGRPPARTAEHLRRVATAKLAVASPEYLRRYGS
jgi:Domain of unknown function (DUF6285)